MLTLVVISPGAEKAFVKTALSILGGTDAPVLENVALRFMTGMLFYIFPCTV